MVFPEALEGSREHYSKFSCELYHNSWKYEKKMSVAMDNKVETGKKNEAERYY
jgi:hypothetical protein